MAVFLAEESFFGHIWPVFCLIAMPSFWEKIHVVTGPFVVAEQAHFVLFSRTVVQEVPHRLIFQTGFPNSVLTVGRYIAYGHFASRS